MSTVSKKARICLYSQHPVCPASLPACPGSSPGQVTWWARSAALSPRGLRAQVHPRSWCTLCTADVFMVGAGPGVGAVMPGEPATGLESAGEVEKAPSLERSDVHLTHNKNPGPSWPIGHTCSFWPPSLPFLSQVLSHPSLIAPGS
jgi:hypothetical protein